MKPLINILPIERLKALLPEATVISVYSGDDVITGHEAEGDSTIYAAALNVWHQLVKSGEARDPRAISQWIDDSNPDNRLFSKIEQVLGKSILMDCAWLKAEYNGKEVASIVILRHNPSHLLLADVAFVDPTKCGTKGLGQLAPLLDDLRAYAAENGIRHLTATACDRGISSLLVRYGLPVEDSKFGRMALASGHSIPHEETI